MTMKIHQARDTGKQFYLQIWLDTTKELMVPELDEDGKVVKDEVGQVVMVAVPGEPDPEWLREWRWGKDTPRATMRRETRLLAQTELDKMNAVGTTLSEEGQTL